jgi:hypothetical protein
MGGLGVTSGERNVVKAHAESLSCLVSAVRTGGTLSSVSMISIVLSRLGHQDSGHSYPGRSGSGGVVRAADTGLLLGDDLIVWILLALGGALFVGNVMALVRPPVAPRQEGDLEQAPRGRSIFMASVGFVVAIVALASLLR